MAITLPSIVLHRNEQGTLEVWYETLDPKPIISKFSCTLNDQITNFALNAIWINEQPANCLPKLFSAKIEPGSIGHFKIINGELILTLQLLKMITVFVMCTSLVSDMPVQTLHVSPELTVLGLKKTIQKKLGFLNFEIINNEGLSFIEVSRTLHHYGICDQSIILLLKEQDFTIPREAPAPRTGAPEFGFTSFIFVNFEDKKDLNLNNRAPVWRTIRVGLNLEGQCTNKACQAYLQNVIVMVGLEQEIRLSKDRFCKCPMDKCKSEIIVTNCIFWDCTYEIVGLLENSSPDQKTFIPGIAKKDKPVSFAEISPEQYSNLVKWKYLNIIAKENKTQYLFCHLL